jgi:glycosyltransferase domain-containing protein
LDLDRLNDMRINLHIRQKLGELAQTFRPPPGSPGFANAATETFVARLLDTLFRIDDSHREKSIPAGTSDLTIILPTHNRPQLCQAQIRFLQGCGVRHRVIVADSSDEPDDELRKACTGQIEYRGFRPSTPPLIKFAMVARKVATPYLAMMTDDDISLPHAIDACLEHLQSNPDYVVAQGYVLNFSMRDALFDIHSVRWFTGSNAEGTPLRRLYELMRRYQPLYWTVFRTGAFIRANEAANAVKGAIFQELAFTATIALLGKSARLPAVQTLRGDVKSTTPAVEAHPFYWFLKDAQSFFVGYDRYRDALANMVQELGSGRHSGPQRDVDGLRRVLDIIHASYLAREIDMDAIDDAARGGSGEPLGTMGLPTPTPPATAEGPGDLAHASSLSGRRYVWRNAVLNGEESSEVAISSQEIARVEAALDKYQPATVLRRQ